MCGIVGGVSGLPIQGVILEGISRLSYRGYDSAGLATMQDGQIDIRKVKGKVEKLKVVLEGMPLTGTIGIGHTRWATHGLSVDINAHPHKAGRVAIAHNGIVENWRHLRAEAEAKGSIFLSQTDTEVIPHLINHLLTEGVPALEAVRRTVLRLAGQSAIVCLIEGQEEEIIFACKGKSLVLGLGTDGTFIGSDQVAFVGLAERVVYTHDYDIGVIRKGSYEIYGVDGVAVNREIQKISVTMDDLSIGQYTHVTEKEIWEQPDRLGDTIHALSDPETHRIFLPTLPFDLGSITRLYIVACGTAYLAGLTAKYWFEAMGLSVECDSASEFRYRESEIDPQAGAIVISQSGETEDTFEALRRLHESCQTLAIVNVAETRIPRFAHGYIRTGAGGRERGVAATKSFTTQLVVLAALAIETGRKREKLTPEREAELVRELDLLPAHVQAVISKSEHIRAIARELTKATDVYFVGRGTSYCIALEGALKLKELSYIHAEGFSAGELKHGPIALIEPGTPVVAIAPHDQLFDKMASNVGLVTTKGASVILFSDEKGCKALQASVWKTVSLPEVDMFFSPIVYAVAVQLLAYHIATLKGTDVDQPRNLAKSVTVE